MRRKYPKQKPHRRARSLYDGVVSSTKFGPRLRKLKIRKKPKRRHPKGRV